MRCQSCQLVLAFDDNYCRRCGAAVRVVEPPPPEPEPTAVVRVGPSAPALLASAAAPLATGAAVVAAGALMRFAARRALRALLGGGGSGGGAAPVTPRIVERAVPGGRLRVTEIYWSRTIERS